MCKPISDCNSLVQQVFALDTMLLKSLGRFVCSVTAEECLERYCTQEHKNSLTWGGVVMVAGWEVCGGGVGGGEREREKANSYSRAVVYLCDEPLVPTVS